MKRQRLISKGSLSRLFQDAVEAWRRQDYQETIALLERASRLDPANTNVLLDLGRAYGLRYEFESAERCFEKAIKIAPRKIDALIEAGLRSQAFGNYQMSAGYFERATREKGATADVFVTLAELYERGPRANESASLVERALSLQLDHPLSLLARARLKRMAGELEAAEKITRELLQKPSCDPQTRMRAWYELGANLDRQGRFDEAMNAFLEAKAVQRPGAAQPAAILEGVQARVREEEQTITANVLQRWGKLNPELAPARRLAILCGHPRSGTTLLEQVLDSHPEIVSSEETHILHDEAYLPLSRGFAESSSVLQVLEAAAPSQLRQSRDNYFRFTERFIGKPLADKLLIDKNPALNVLIPAVVRIFPEAKFLVALRDPRDVCLSCFMQLLPMNPVSSAYLTLEGTVTQYASVMGFWQAMLPRMRNPSIEVRYEDMVHDLPAAARRVLDFLGVAWDARVLQYHEHARSKQVRSPSYADVAKPLFKSAIGRWRNYEKFLDPFQEKLARFTKAYGYD
jgi:tetratricopeptide (TPR) repeat protein